VRLTRSVGGIIPPSSVVYLSQRARSVGGVPRRETGFCFLCRENPLFLSCEFKEYYGIIKLNIRLITKKRQDFMEQITLHDKIFGRYISSPEITDAVKNIAEHINNDMKDEDLPVFLSVLNGSFMFTSDLMKHIRFNCLLSFIKLSSYDGLSSGGTIRELIGLNLDLTGKTVIVLEDVVDTGATLEYLIDTILKHKPKQLKIATMLFKPAAYGKDLKPDYVGICVPNDFIVGYGLDYNGLGRNYPEIYKLVK
jgi:hypoxanthine phosphoribosyltransferase